MEINGSEAGALMTSGVALLPMNTNLGRNMRIMEMNIWLLEQPLLILKIEIFDINPPMAKGGHAGFPIFLENEKSFSAN